jgi:hypothetical protein
MLSPRIPGRTAMKLPRKFTSMSKKVTILISRGHHQEIAEESGAGRRGVGSK